MYRKIALTSLTLNFVFAFATLFLFLPWLTNILKDLKIDLPTPIIWLFSVQSFITNPRSIIPLMVLSLIGFVGVRYLRKRA